MFHTAQDTLFGVMPAYLGIDLGTQSLKALLLDADRGILGSASEPLSLLPNLPTGHSEQDPADWLDALRSAVRKVLAETDTPAGAISAIGVSGQQHGFVPLDRDHQVIRPAKLWNDVSSAAQCAALRSEIGKERLFDLTSNHLPPGFTGGKIRWLREEEPENHQRLALVLLPHDYINLWLTGDPVCEAGDASGTGFFDIASRQFVPEVMETIAPGLAGCMPEILAPGEAAGRLCAHASSELGLAEGTLVSAGSGDNMMAALGSGAVNPGVVVMSIGTSGTVFACADQPVRDPEGEIAAFCDATGHWLPLGCTMNATVTTELTRSALGISIDELEDLVASAPAGADGALCLPFFTGERSPDLPEGTGAFLGLTPTNFDRAHVARAAMEGATFALARLLDRLIALGLSVEEVRLTGGGSQSPTWRRIIASAIDRPITTGIAADAAALGAAVHACWTHRRSESPDYTAAGCFADLELESGLQQELPDPQWSEIYRQRRRAYENAVRALTPEFPSLRSSP